MGEMGKGNVLVRIGQMAEATIQKCPKFIYSLEVGATLTILAATKNMRSRMKGDFNVRRRTELGRSILYDLL